MYTITYIGMDRSENSMKTEKIKDTRSRITYLEEHGAQCISVTDTETGEEIDLDNLPIWKNDICIECGGNKTGIEYCDHCKGEFDHEDIQTVYNPEGIKWKDKSLHESVIEHLAACGELIDSHREREVMQMNVLESIQCIINTLLLRIQDRNNNAKLEDFINSLFTTWL